ncbi:DUF5691 domain-containing protein [Thiothrix lacustris]|uniref:DUF5691 domain-containing protein n=1 Tax=Thiothrix lacustris TaxID=525917 RepID=A0ABY9MSX3_9GAMM|nr:DUF5691 domain-containing protein [Thiothrix lacustris]WML90931.1 DUF5691 domain-containing protein [Thiothrix lacustris]
MPLQQTLLKIALLGTERQTQAPQGNTALQPYLAQLYPQGQVPTDSSRESAFLSAAALALQYRAAGNLPAVFTGTLASPDVKPDLPLIPPAAEMHLRRMLADSHLHPLLHGWLERVAAKRLRVPTTFIPALMEQAQQSRAIRPAISAVIGQRGHWLCNQHPDWQRLLTLTLETADHDVSIWEEGNSAQRAEYLRQLRPHQPAEARELLQAVWKQEAAPVRQELLQALQTNLGMADEAWLETCLDDRSKGVSQLAAELLGALPDSAFSQRMQTRLVHWLAIQTKTGLLNKLGGKKTLQVNLPETWDKSWLRDGIEEKPPQGKGAKAWWLEQALSFVPPVRLAQRWQATPDTLLLLSCRSDWSTTFRAGWEQALHRYPNTDWSTAWFTHINPGDNVLWQQLSPPLAEQTASALLSRDDSPQLLNLLPSLQHPWSTTFSRQVLPAVAKQVQTTLLSYATHTVVRHFAIHAAPVCAEEFATLLHEPLQADQSNGIKRLLTETLFTLRFRADMLTALENA